MSGNQTETSRKSQVYLGPDRVLSGSDLTLRRADGSVVPLRRQSLQVLRILAEHPGQLVHKDTLMDAVWDQVAVTEDSLTKCIADIRRALEDADHRVVRTLARQGYMLVPQVPDAPEGPERTRLGALPLLAAAMALVAVLGAVAWWLWPASPVPGRAAIAVLAFDDLSSEPDRGFLSDGISEGIITELARFPEFDTIARNSSFSFRDTPHDIRHIATTLGADYVLEGSQQKEGERLRVTAQLILGADGTHIWAETYDSQVGDLFSVQDRIIRSVAATVGGKLTEYVPAKGHRETVTAMSLHAKGSQLMRKGTSEDTEAAKALFEASIEADPDAPFGYQGMGFYHRYQTNFAPDAESKARHLALANDYADKALQMAPRNYLSHYLKGRLLVQEGDMAQANVRFDAAKEMNPSASFVYVGGASPLLYVGNYDAAIADIQHAMDIDPLHAEWYHWQMGWALWEKKDCEGAWASFQRMTDVPNNARRMLAAIHVCRGDIEAARAEIGQFMQHRPGATLAKEYAQSKDIWTAPGSLDRWISDLRIAGMPE